MGLYFNFDTVDEMDAFIKHISLINIYDDVAELQEKVSALAAADDELQDVVETLNIDKLSASSVNLNDANLNEQIGKIIVGYGNNCINKPGGQNGYFINIPHNSAPERYGKQIFIARPANNVFVRNLDDGVFGEWTYVYYDSGWRTLSLASGISEHNPNAYPCRYRRLGNVVYIEGCVKGFAEVEKVVATLPDGFRPNKGFYLQTATNSGKTDTFNVTTGGEIKRVATTLSPLSAENYHFLNMSYLVN